MVPSQYETRICSGVEHFYNNFESDRRILSKDKFGQIPVGKGQFADYSCNILPYHTVKT